MANNNYNSRMTPSAGRHLPSPPPPPSTPTKCSNSILDALLHHLGLQSLTGTLVNQCNGQSTRWTCWDSSFHVIFNTHCQLQRSHSPVLRFLKGATNVWLTGLFKTRNGEMTKWWNDIYKVQKLFSFWKTEMIKTKRKRKTNIGQARPFRARIFCFFVCLFVFLFFPASRGPFSFEFAELTDGTKRDLCHWSKWTVLSMHHGYLATETSRDAFSTWSADDSHLSQLARQNTPAQFCCREWRVHQNPKQSRQFV